MSSLLKYKLVRYAVFGAAFIALIVVASILAPEIVSIDVVSLSDWLKQNTSTLLVIRLCVYGLSIWLIPRALGLQPVNKARLYTVILIALSEIILVQKLWMN